MTNTVDQQARFALTMFETTQQYMHLRPDARDAAIRLLDAGTQTSGVGNNLEAAGTGSVTA